MVKKILSEHSVSLPEVKEIMQTVREKLNLIEKDFEPIQEYTYEYVKTFSKVDGEVAKKVIKMLTQEYSMDENTAIQVINIDPHYVYELQVIFEKHPEMKNLKEEQLQEMLYKINDIRDH